jgi:hypothetical protein
MALGLQMLKYADVVQYLTQTLPPQYSDIYYSHGPSTDTSTFDSVPDSIIVVTIGSGPGFDSEMLFDRSMVQIRSIGPQFDYSGAEDLADAIDKALVAVDSSRLINGKWTLSIVRSGGPPAPLLRDDGDRHHFTCNYVWEVEYV